MRRVARVARFASVILVALVALVGGSACARSGGTSDGLDESVVLPTGPAQVMAASRHVGGFVPPGWTVLAAPRVVVYSDGRAIADASRVLTLPPAQVRTLVSQLRQDLRGVGPTATSAESEGIADAPSVVLQVRVATGGLQEVSAYALGIVGGYPRNLVAARDRLETLALRVAREGAAYTAERVRVVAEQRGEGGAIADWPAAIPVPPVNALGVRTADLDGRAAAALTAAIPAVPERSGPWPVLRLPDGALVGVAWRYLLPDE